MKSLQSFIKESKIEDPTIVASMDDFYRLQEEINQLSTKLKEAKKQFGEYGKQITPLLDSMQETGEKLAETDDYLIKIKRFAHERSSASYKNAFEMALGKVNSATRNILEESLAASKKITNIGHSFEIGTNESESIDENILSKMIQGLKSVVKKFIGIFKRESKNIDNANKDLKDLSSGKMESVNEARISVGLDWMEDEAPLNDKDAIRKNPKKHKELVSSMKALKVKFVTDNGDQGGGHPEYVFSGDKKAIQSFMDKWYGGVNADEYILKSVNEGVLRDKIMIPAELNVSYDIDRSIWAEYNSSEDDAASQIAAELDLLEGYIEWSSDTFKVKGKTKFGKEIFAIQEGQYNMYGGPYSPIMEKPIIRFNDKDITKMVIKHLEKEVGVEDMRGKKSGYNFPDISRVDLWSNLLIKLR